MSSQAKDDFLIIGFTGPSGSGCTTGARFFENELELYIKNYSANEDAINSTIINYYQKNADKAKSKEKAAHKKEAGLRFLRERQYIRALKNISDTNFLYISLTTILHHLMLVNSNSSRDIDHKYINTISHIQSVKSTLCVDDATITEIDNILKDKTPATKDLEHMLDYFEILEINRDKFRNENISMFNYIENMQELGNNVRSTGFPFKSVSISSNNYFDILSRYACYYLKKHRRYIKDTTTGDIKTYYVVECFRNPSEINYFRKRFNEFYLFSVYRDEKTRFSTFKKKFKFTPDECVKVDAQDQGNDYTDDLAKQNIKTCVNLADISVTNDATYNDYKTCLLKYFALIKSPGCVNPTHDERNMHLAYSVSLNSTCICRQVGAVIVKNGYVIGIGWNDAESFNIGCLFRYRHDAINIEKDYFPLGYEEDHERIKEIIKEGGHQNESFCFKNAYGEFKRIKKFTNGEDENCREIIKNIQTKSLQECRSLHAEENAILQVARTQSGNLDNATIYSTTFPCELCTKKILQVGITKIVYCEPYPRSISQSVFLAEHMRAIEITPFEGVKSPAFFKLFKSPLALVDLQKMSIHPL